MVNIDRFIATNQPLWHRLAALTSLASSPAQMRPADLDELVAAYERVNTHLSIARTTYRDPVLIESLTALTARAGSVVYGSRPRTWRAIGRFITDTFPAAVWHVRAFVLVSTLLFVIPATGLAVWLASSPEALELVAPPALREAYLEEDFEDYYSSKPAAQFASEVMTNNIRVGIMAFGAGIGLCLPTVYVLVANGLNLGFAAGLFAAAGQQPKFWGLILPHGLLELTAVFVAGAAGLRLGWTLIDPGDRPRGEALTFEGRRAIVIVIGLVGVFGIAGLIEGFVTGSRLPTAVRVGIGVIAELAFILLVCVRGRAAAARGVTGALGEDRTRGWTQASTGAPSPSP